MNSLNRSLRLRLLVLILVPLLIVSMAAVYWRFEVARKTAEEIFDRNLVMMSLAISRDVALSCGDSLSPVTTNMFRDATGGDIFYHVYGPDGSFVTGYSSPPVYPKHLEQPTFDEPVLFNSSHLGRPIRAARLAEQVLVDGISGRSVITVWQPLEPRQMFAASMTRKAAMVAAFLLISVANLVFFGIRYGLRPLKELEAAITKRSSLDLSPIVREIPHEAKGIVARLNKLFSQVNDANEAKDRLVSNAAHQLRNPIAAVHSLAVATLNADDPDVMKNRAFELVKETRRAARLTEQLLSLERLRGKAIKKTAVDLNAFLTREASQLGARALGQNIDFELKLEHKTTFIELDETLMGEVLSNLVENAFAHGGASLTAITIQSKTLETTVHIDVTNDGAPIPQVRQNDIFERFSQGHESQGSGLGLSIVSEIMNLHQGSVALTSDTSLTRFDLILPLPHKEA